MRHSDSKTEFETGAYRDSDDGKGRHSLVSSVLMHRLGVHLGKGEDHYGTYNYLKGMPFLRTMDSLLHHAFLWLAGDEEEDHLAAIVANSQFLMDFEAMIANGALPTSLDDRCKALKEILPSILTPPPPEPTLGRIAEKHNSLDEFVEFQDTLDLRPCGGSCGGMTVWSDGYCTACTMNGENPNDVG